MFYGLNAKAHAEGVADRHDRDVRFARARNRTLSGSCADPDRAVESRRHLSPRP